MLEITDKEFLKLSDFIKLNYGINLGKEKKILLVNRLQNILIEHSLKNFTEYYNFIISDTTGNAVSTLVDKISTNHTFFMREEQHFNYFKDRVLPYLTSTTTNNDLHLWSAGCSTGEEPYTLAILIDQYLGLQKTLWNTKILATDLSSRVLENAIKGVYHPDQLSKLPDSWIKKYFRHCGANLEIVDKLKSEVIFRRLNLMDEIFPFKKKMHVIFCRNVMIYFDKVTKKALIDKFFKITEPGGYLFIGLSETIDKNETAYKCVGPSIYRKE